MKLIVGTRGSTLAIAQTEIVIGKLSEKYSDLSIEKKIIITKGDKDKSTALNKIGDKGIFVSEIEKQLIEGNIDFAVHSYKDMPSEIDEKLMLVDTPDRSDPRDALIINPKYNLVNQELKDWIINTKGLRIGIGSIRRKSQMLRMNKSIEAIGIRGNIETRIDKMIKEDLDGIILAASGIKRLGKDNLNVYYFSYEEMIPSPAQGALAIEIRKERKDLIKLFDSISDKPESIKVKAERSFMKTINGGCHSPVGAIATIDGKTLSLRGIFGDSKGKSIVIDEICGDLENAEELGCKLAEMLLDKLSLEDEL
ncbi:hydroxymethylbilane synthase [Peptostreptococcus sp. D1]|uniref:hydroxymethylbilane synthase n=1 Tax=Peptostreptococcus sp. D1 TaxID=72304 RepID=UPI0008E5D6B0|nr:hydroxymethylbilane synthase [Peptostreptococcus sp. D1]SFE24153.1 hydroxymethylbilane synthase [Peptostreptococcus sp. D1]